MQRFESSRPGRRDSNLCISKSDLLKWLNGIWAAGRRLDCKKCGTRTCNSRCGSSSPAPRAESLTTEDWAGCNSADALNCPMERRIFVERAMNSMSRNSRLAVLILGFAILTATATAWYFRAGIGGKPSAEALSFYQKGVDDIQGGAFFAAVDLTPIADQVAWRLIPRECFRNLLRDPF